MSWLRKSQFKPMPFSDEELEYGPDLESEEYAEIPRSLPRVPQCLVVVDVQKEFNKSIYFNTSDFFRYLKQCSDQGSEIHVVYDSLGDRPTMFNNFSNVRFYEKNFGADPYEGVIDKQTQQLIDASEMDYGVLYFDPSARLDIFRSDGHEYQHVYPDMIKLIAQIKGKDVGVLGGAHAECLTDMLTWLDMNSVNYDLVQQFVY